MLRKIKSSYRMKPSKRLAPHGASNGANHLNPLVTPIARSLSLTSLVALSQNPLWTLPSLCRTPAGRPCLNCRPLIAGSFRWPPGGSCSPPLSLVKRITWPELWLVTWPPCWLLIGRIPFVEDCDWLRAADAPVGTEEKQGAPALITLWEHVSNLVNVVSWNCYKPLMIWITKQLQDSLSEQNHWPPIISWLNCKLHSLYTTIKKKLLLTFASLRF